MDWYFSNYNGKWAYDMLKHSINNHNHPIDMRIYEIIGWWWWWWWWWWWFFILFYPTFFSLHSGFTWNFSLAGFSKQGTLQVHLSGVSISKNLEPVYVHSKGIWWVLGQKSMDFELSMEEPAVGTKNNFTSETGLSWGLVRDRDRQLDLLPGWRQVGNGPMDPIMQRFQRQIPIFRLENNRKTLGKP